MWHFSVLVISMTLLAPVGSSLRTDKKTDHAGLSSTSAPPPSATYKINSQHFISNPVPSNFAGFSYEVPCAPDMLSDKCLGDCPSPQKGPFPQKTSYMNMVNTLRTRVFEPEATNTTPPSSFAEAAGPNIRIGGNSADQTWFQNLPGTPLGPQDNNAVTIQDISTYQFVSTWNGTVTIDLNINQQHNYTNSVEYAVAATELLTEEVIAGFEIGNEPDLFSRNGIASKNYSFDTYNAEFQRYADALWVQGKGLITMPRIQGAVFACCWTQHLINYTKQWTTPGSFGSSTQNLLSTVSQHHYPLSPEAASLSALMKPETASNVGQFAEQATYANARGVPFIIGEGNSVFDGGVKGVSDVLAAAFWAIDTMSYAAVANISRWNFHGCPSGAYTPISLRYDASQGKDVANARPLFYGMWVFSRLVDYGARFLETEMESSSSSSSKGLENQNIAQWTTKSDHFTKTVLLQKTVENATTVFITLDYGPEYGNSSVKFSYLKPVGGSSVGLRETENIEFGGLTFQNSPDGKPWSIHAAENAKNGKKVVDFTDNDGKVTVEVEEANCVLVELRL